MVGIGVIYANWVGLVGFVVPCLVIIIWRIRIEEAALLRTVGPAYQMYATRRKRLVPFVW